MWKSLLFILRHWLLLCLCLSNWLEVQVSLSFAMWRVSASSRPLALGSGQQELEVQLHIQLPALNVFNSTVSSSGAQERHGPVRVVPEQGTQKSSESCNTSLKEDTLRELEFFSLEKRRVQDDLIAAFQYLKWDYEKNGDKRFSTGCCDRTRGSALG